MARIESLLLPTGVEFRAERDGIVGYLRTLIRQLDSNQRRVSSVVNENATGEQFVVGDNGTDYVNNWSAAADTKTPLAYWRVGDETCFLVGSLEHTTGSPGVSTIFTLPPAFRPAAEVRGFIHTDTNGVGGPQIDNVVIESDGDVVYKSGRSFTSSLDLHISMAWRRAS